MITLLINRFLREFSLRNLSTTYGVVTILTANHGDLKMTYLKVNWHLLSECNFRCCYCFRENFSRKCLEDNLFVLDKLGGYFSEINFVGGEITELPYIQELIRAAYHRGFKCSLVTNGFDFIHESAQWRTLYPYLTTVGISIDSLLEETNLQIGRHKRGRTITRAEYEDFCAEIKQEGLRLKVNTVVSRLNLKEEFVEFYRTVLPDRIKLMQVFKPNRRLITNYDKLLISPEEFATFVARNRHSDYNDKLVIEGGDDMSDSYYILLGDGAFVDRNSDVKGPSLSNQNVTLQEALAPIDIDLKKYEARYTPSNSSTEPCLSDFV